MGLPRHSWLILIACLVLLTGCAGSGSPPPGVSEVVFGIVVAVWKLRKMGDDPLLRAGSSKSAARSLDRKLSIAASLLCTRNTAAPAAANTSAFLS